MLRHGAGGLAKPRPGQALNIMDMGSVLRAGGKGEPGESEQERSSNVTNTTGASVEGCLEKAARRLQKQ